jgi:hypothetical protein
MLRFAKLIERVMNVLAAVVASQVAPGGANGIARAARRSISTNASRADSPAWRTATSVAPWIDVKAPGPGIS